MSKYSIFNLIRNALSHHEHWDIAWRSPEPKGAYDVVIIGGGGHGLATAYYLAKEHGITSVAVLEKGWIGGGNTGRNTTIVRSNYLWDEATHLYEKSMKLWEGLSQDLNFNVMFSQRGVLNLGHSLQDMRDIERRVNANRLNGVDGHVLDTAQVMVGVDTSRGFINAKKIGVVVAGHASVLAAMADLRLPIESHPLQALVSEPIKPILDTVVMSNAVHGYVSQSDRGDLVIGAGIDAYTGYGQRGSFSIIESTLAAIVELFPIFSRVRMNRQWGGIVDVCPDACPIIGLTPVKGLYFNCGWGTRGFKATPGSGWVFAHTIAQDRPHDLNAAFSLDRFFTGHLIDEHGAAAVAH